MRRLARTVIVLLAIVVAGDAASALAVGVYRRSLLGVPVTDTLERFPVTAWAAGWLGGHARAARLSSRVAPFVAGRRYLGVLEPDSPSWNELFPVDPLLGHGLGRNVVAVVRDSVYVTNAQGFVSIGDAVFTYERPKPDGVFRVIMIGGSTVLGQGAPTPAENLPARLRDRLVRRYPTLEMINAGVGGYTSGQELLRFGAELLPYSPDLLIVYDGWNDHHFMSVLIQQIPDAATNSLKAPTHYELQARLARSYTVAGSLRTFVGVVKARTVDALRHLATFVLLESAAGGAAGKIRATSSAPDARVLADVTDRTAVLYERNLRAMIGTAVASGVRIAVILQPVMGVDGKQLTAEERTFERRASGFDARRRFYEAARGTFGRLQREWAGTRSVCIGDLSHVLGSVTDTVYTDSGHLNREGNDVVATAIEATLARCAVLPKQAGVSLHDPTPGGAPPRSRPS